MNREKLVKSELEYSDYSESEEENSSIKEDRSLIKRRDTEDDDDGDREQIRLHNSSKIKDSIKISIPSEETSYGNSSNGSKENSNNKNTSINNIDVSIVFNDITRSLFIY
jgi:hypothetical protein